MTIKILSRNAVMSAVFMCEWVVYVLASIFVFSTVGKKPYMVGDYQRSASEPNSQSG